MPTSTPPSPVPPATSPAPATNKPVRRPWWCSNRTWGLLALMLFFLGGGSLIPVDKVPFLRNLVYAMGYTPDEAKGMSFFKALLSWNEHTSRRAMAAENDFSIYSKNDPFSASSAERAQNKLINIRSVNKALAKRGRRGDFVAGVYQKIPGVDDSVDDTAPVVQADASAATQANQVKNAPVFFGEDTSAIKRDTTDAFNSVNTLKRVTDKPIAGYSGDDWLIRTVDRVTRSEVDFSDLTKRADPQDASTASTQIKDIKKLGNTRAQRDLYYAWLTSRAARRTTQPSLGKALASAGFIGAEIPRAVYSATGFSGVGINPEDVVTDMESVKKYLELDKKCKEALKNSRDFTPNISDMRQRIDSLSSADVFPQNCAMRGSSTFNDTLRGISNSCQQMKYAYEQIRRECASISLNLQDSQCHTETLSAYYTAFDAYCSDKERACQALSDIEARATCLAQVARIPSSQDFNEPGSNIYFNSNQLSDDVRRTFYDDDGDGLNLDYFPGVDWGRSLWTDPLAEQ